MNTIHFFEALIFINLSAVCFSEQLFLPGIYNKDFESNPGKEYFLMWNLSFIIRAFLTKKLMESKHTKRKYFFL